jgi:hydrogenase expression/formation protein HypC
MCLGVPGRIVSIEGSQEFATAVVAFGGMTRRICVALVPDAAPGDYVLVHAGIALQTIDEKHAHELLEHLRSMGDGELSEFGEEANREAS